MSLDGSIRVQLVREADQGPPLHLLSTPYSNRLQYTRAGDRGAGHATIHSEKGAEVLTIRQFTIHNTGTRVLKMQQITI